MIFFKPGIENLDGMVGDYRHLLAVHCTKEQYGENSHLGMCVKLLCMVVCRIVIIIWMDVKLRCMDVCYVWMCVMYGCVLCMDVCYVWMCVELFYMDVCRIAPYGCV